MQKWARAARWAAAAAVLACCLYLAWNVPYTHDDWDWGLEVGLDRWLSGQLNNRYAGTFFVLAMTRSPVFKTLTMGLTMFLIPAMSAYLAAGRHTSSRFPLFLAAAGIFFTMPMTAWSQTLGWVSAFANFVIPCPLVLLLILLAKKALDQGGGRWLPAVLFPLALVCQLFAENLTLVLVCASVLFFGYAVRSRRAVGPAAALLAGAALGAVLMFWNPLYVDLLATGTAVEGVRHLAVPSGAGLGEIVSTAVTRLTTIIFPSLLQSQPALWALACAGGLWRMAKSGRPLWLILPAGFLCAPLLWYAWLAADASWRGLPAPLPTLQLVSGPAVILFLFLALWTDRDRQRRWPRLLLLAGILALIAPFGLVKDFGSRCYFVSLILLLLLSLSMLADFPWHPWGTAAAALLTAGTLVFHLHVYSVIGGCSNLRQQLLSQAVSQGEDHVLLPTEDWKYSYSWGRNPQSEPRAVYFRQFYGLPSELELIFLPPGSYDLWPEISEEMIDYGINY